MESARYIVMLGKVGVMIYKSSKREITMHEFLYEDKGRERCLRLANLCMSLMRNVLIINGERLIFRRQTPDGKAPIRSLRRSG